MTQTITGKLFFVREGDFERTYHYLESIGMAGERMRQSFASNEYLDKEEAFYIELKRMPEIMTKLERNGYHAPHRNRKEWNITSITPEGIVLYVCGPDMGDGWIFVPREKIVSIHTVSTEQLKVCDETRQSYLARNVIENSISGGWCL